ELMRPAAAPNAPRIEYHTAAGGPVLGLGTPRPRLSWSVPSAQAGYTQTAYEIEVSRESGIQRYRVQNAEQVLVPWPTDPLRSRERAEVRVRVADKDDWTDWSSATTLEVGLLHRGDWTASFISPASLVGRNMPAPILTGQIEIQGPIAKARLYATAHGVYVPSINGFPVADHVLAPGWTAYDHRLRYQTYDVTDLKL